MMHNQAATCQSGHPLQARTIFLSAVAACLVVLLVMALPLAMGRLYVADDLGEFHLPLRAFYAQQLERSEPFDWMPNLFAGFYITGEGQLGGYHPVHWLLYRTLPLQVAFGLEVLLSYPLLLWGTYLLLKRELASRDAAVYGSLVFTFSGFCLLHFIHVNAIAVVAHLPWLLLAVSCALTAECGRARSLALLFVGLLTASQNLLGYPQYVWFTWIVVLPFCMWKSGWRREHWPRLLEIGLFAAFGILAAAVQLLPTFDALSTSTRAAVTAGFSGWGSLHPLNLLQLVAPYLFATRVVGQNTHELGLYLGAAPLLLSVWMLAHQAARSHNRRIIVAAVTLGVFGLLLALGDYCPANQMTAWLPIVNRFRFPCRAIVIVHFSMSILAAVGFVELLKQAEARRGMFNLARSVCSFVLISLATACIACYLWPEFVADWRLICAGPVLFVTAALLILATAQGSRVALAGLVAFTTADLAVYGLSYSILGKTATLADYATPPPQLKAGDRIAASPNAASGPSMGNRLLLAGAVRVDGYAGLMPRRVLDYGRIENLRNAATDFLITPDMKTHWFLAPVPPVRLVSQTAPLDSHVPTSGEIVLVDRALNLPQSTPGEVQVLNARPGYWSLRTTAPARQLLVLAESFHSGWTATIDDRPVRVLRANGDFMGCEVDGGVHNVQLRFDPASLHYGRMTSILGVSLLLCSFGIRLARSKTAL